MAATWQRTVISSSKSCWPISKVGFIKYGEGMFNAAAAARRFALKSNSHVALLFSLFLPPFLLDGSSASSVLNI